MKLALTVFLLLGASLAAFAGRVVVEVTPERLAAAGNPFRIPYTVQVTLTNGLATFTVTAGVPPQSWEPKVSLQVLAPPDPIIRDEGGHKKGISWHVVSSEPVEPEGLTNLVYTFSLPIGDMGTKLFVYQLFKEPSDSALIQLPATYFFGLTKFIDGTGPPNNEIQPTN